MIDYCNLASFRLALPLVLEKTIYQQACLPSAYCRPVKLQLIIHYQS